MTSIPTDPMTNRIASAALAAYDAAGNMTSLSGHTYEYDELNQLVSRDPDLGANQDSLWSAIYTADDERLAVWEVEAEDSGWEARWTLRGLDGKVLRQYAFSRSGAGESIFEDGFESGDLCAWTDDSGSGPTCRSHGWFWERDHVYRDGQLLAEVGELNVLHRHVDHLGSLRQVTDELGIWQEDHAYLPFGEEVPVSSRAPLQFTGHERDSHGAGSADDLDYMHARYYSPGIGRFLSVDPENDSSRKHPQSRNRYTYARNNPLKYVDRDGKAIDTALDVGFVLFDVGDIAVTALKGEEVTSTQKTALAADLLGAAVPFATGAGLATRLAPRLAVRSGVLGKVGRFFFRRSARGGFIGQGVSKAGLVQSGRSRGFQRVNSNLSGGAKGAQDLFQGLTGRTPSQAMLASEGFDRVVLKDEGLEVVFRGTSSSGAAKVEVINLSEETIEKITFSALPE